MAGSGQNQTRSTFATASRPLLMLILPQAAAVR
jgi:hypothetical protein